MKFLEDVLYHIPRATKKEKESIRAELENHLLDHQEALTEKGMAPQEARRKAEEAMGDPAEIGWEFNEGLSPFWLWAKRAIQGAICLVLITAFYISVYGSDKLWTGTWDVLSGAWKNYQARQGKDLAFAGREVETAFVDYAWDCWEVMRVGDEMVCLYRVELGENHAQKGTYYGDFYFCTYNEDPFAPANKEIFGQLTVTPESGITGDPEYPWGWEFTHGSRSVWESRYRTLVMEGDTYVDVTYDHYGTYVTMRCPLTWEEVEP